MSNLTRLGVFSNLDLTQLGVISNSLTRLGVFSNMDLTQSGVTSNSLTRLGVFSNMDLTQLGDFIQLLGLTLVTISSGVPGPYCQSHLVFLWCLEYLWDLTQLGKRCSYGQKWVRDSNGGPFPNRVRSHRYSNTLPLGAPMGTKPNWDINPNPREAF